MRDTRIKVLLVTDNPGDTRLTWTLVAEANGEPFGLDGVHGLSSVLDRLARRGIDVVPLDSLLPDVRAIDTFVKENTCAPGVPIIVITETDDYTPTLQAVEFGAQDSLVKEKADSDVLFRYLRQAIERKRSEGAEREANQTVRALIDTSPLAIVANDRDAKVQIWNPAAERLFGWTESEVLGCPYPLIPEEHQDEWRQYLDRRLRGEVLVGLETQRLRKDGSLVDVGIWTAPLCDARGEIQSVMGIIADLTGRKQAEEALVTQVRELAVMEERNRIAREIHDSLAQGFTGIVLQLEAAEEALRKRPGSVPDHLGRAKKLARESLQEARRSVWDLLPQALEQRRLESALADAVRRFSATGPEKVSFTPPGNRRDLPPNVQAAILRICEEALNNIRQHARATEVRVTLLFCPNEIYLGVQDNGIGFETASVKPVPGESGFGLTGMEGRVRLLGGTFVVKSHVGEGTLVEVNIPTG